MNAARPVLRMLKGAAFASAAKGTGGTDAGKMADWLRANQVDSKVGDLAWDAKGGTPRAT